MVEPRIRYAKTSDGVNIAYFTMGEGVPYVRMPAVPMDHIQLQYSTFGKGYAAAVAARMMLVCYDGRGSGMSTRDVMDFSMETFLEDLRCVVDSLEIERFVLEAPNQMAPVGLTFAALHPERVSHLIVRSGAARNRDLWSRRIASTHAMLTNAPDMYRTVTASMAFGPAASNEQAAFMAQCADERVAKLMYDALGTLDATGVLAEVRAPALVTVEADDQVFRRESITKLAAGIGASLVVITPPRGALSEWAKSAVPAVLSYLEEQGVIEEDVARAPRAPESEASGTAVILFTDIADSTALTERMGDVAFRDASRTLDAGLRSAIRDAGGEAIEGKLLGDGVLATFPSAAQAIDGARRCLALSAASELGLHIGLHAGDVIREEIDGRRDVFGGAVNIASRICGLSAPGEILVSDVVRGMARTSAGVEFEDRGEQEMKGVGEPLRVYVVRTDGVRGEV